MYSGEVPAVCSQLLPDIRNCVDADNVNSRICEEQEIVHHLIKYPGISVIQIPLIGVKGSHNVMAKLRQIRKIAGSRGRKYLGYCLFKLSRDRIIIIEEVTAHIFSLTPAGTYCPLMVLGGMVHDEIHAHADVSVVAGLCDFL